MRYNSNTFVKTQRPKLGNCKLSVDGIQFDSKREARRYAQLRMLEKAGEITDIRRQVQYELIPGRYEYVPTGEVYKRGERKGQPKMHRVCIERPVYYIADFYYRDTATGAEIVEDAKGYRATNSAPYKVFIIKRKLMLWRYGIRVKEV
jgi:hypothetical protein